MQPSADDFLNMRISSSPGELHYHSLLFHEAPRFHTGIGIFPFPDFDARNIPGNGKNSIVRITAESPLFSPGLRSSSDDVVVVSRASSSDDVDGAVARFPDWDHLPRM
eukprot:GHVU01058506.1.p1 GENE.GHVU01058506.1~~GHVU01058506.1.p1  ORF type:complete len:108 (-),score=5.25 GHVU01058506.1:328-651(-)